MHGNLYIKICKSRNNLLQFYFISLSAGSLFNLAIITWTHFSGVNVIQKVQWPDIDSCSEIDVYLAPDLQLLLEVKEGFS